ncbi:hypothetical protein AV530_005067 [Patagioenas fasciata monilis]|uniref:Uncharacterized protein n=1 Tax=Patagioenas fasciata monilis TaxID=372326 RepID=A0A1V4K467_PATFA|nr:hypothetical protein AV530_005067 [Patagioenas fasciata monilis]
MGGNRNETLDEAPLSNESDPALCTSDSQLGTASPQAAAGLQWISCWSNITGSCRSEGVCKEDLKIPVYESLEVMFTLKTKQPTFVPGFGGAQSNLAKEKVTTGNKEIVLS